MSASEQPIVLLPCPFCGSEKIGFDWSYSENRESRVGFFGCLSCGGGFETFCSGESGNDVDRWNLRQSPCIHDWIDIRNEVIQSGSMCRRCGKLGQ